MLIQKWKSWRWNKKYNSKFETLKREHEKVKRELENIKVLLQYDDCHKPSGIYNNLFYSCNLGGERHFIRIFGKKIVATKDGDWCVKVLKEHKQ